MENLTENQDSFDQGKHPRKFRIGGRVCMTEPLTDRQFIDFIHSVACGSLVGVYDENP